MTTDSRFPEHAVVEIIVTAPDHDWLVSLADRLIDEGLVAAAHITPGVMTIYDWADERHHETESRAALHTRVGLSSLVVNQIEAEHPYAVPGVLVLPAPTSTRYTTWIYQQTLGTTAPD